MTATPEELKALTNALNGVGLTDQVHRRRWIEKALARKLGSSSELTTNDITLCLQALKTARKAMDAFPGSRIRV